jgi:hypothetical protein
VSNPLTLASLEHTITVLAHNNSKIMTTDEVRALADKVRSGQATPEEELALVQAINQGIQDLRAALKDAAVEKQQAALVQSM